MPRVCEWSEDSACYGALAFLCAVRDAGNIESDLHKRFCFLKTIKQEQKVGDGDDTEKRMAPRDQARKVLVINSSEARRAGRAARS